MRYIKKLGVPCVNDNYTAALRSRTVSHIASRVTGLILIPTRVFGFMVSFGDANKPCSLPSDIIASGILSPPKSETTARGVFPGKIANVCWF